VGVGVGSSVAFFAVHCVFSLKIGQGSPSSEGPSGLQIL